MESLTRVENAEGLVEGCSVIKWNACGFGIVSFDQFGWTLSSVVWAYL